MCDLSLQDAERVRKLVRNEITAHHNWIASAVECGQKEYGQSGLSGIVYAANLIYELRELEKLCAKLNGFLNPRP